MSRFQTAYDKFSEQVKKDFNPPRPQDQVIQPVGFQCPFCKSTLGYYEKKKTSTGGWILFVVLLILFFPLCWLGFFVTDKETFCKNCQIKLS